MTAFAGRHALVTGGGRGIGRAIAAALAASGAAVTVLGRSADALQEAVAAKHAAGFITADVTDVAAVQAGVKQAVTERGPVDILIANAGGVETAPFLRTDAERFKRMFDLNVLGVVHAVQAVLPDMIARKSGRIVAVASVAGLKGYPYVSAYCTSKHAVVGLVKSLAIETAKTGITVNAVCPGFADTDMLGDSIEKVTAKTGRTRDAVIAEYVKDMPMGRLIRPEEVAAAVLYLCSPEAGAVTGTAMTIAGGEI